MRNNRYSDLKIVHFPAKLRSFQEGKITAPLYVRLKPINVCNHACSWCVYKADRKQSARNNAAEGALMPSIKSNMHLDMVEKDTIPTAKMLEVLDDFKAMGIRAVTFSGGGEPLLHRDIETFMQRCLNFGIDLSIITNGQLLSDERAKLLSFAKWVRVSMDYTNGTQMARTRVIPESWFDAVMANIQAFARIKQPDCDLGVNYIVHRDNSEGLFAFARQLFEIGVENVRFSPMWCPELVAYHTPIKDRVEAQLREIQGWVESRYGDDGRLRVNTTYDLHSPAHSPVRVYKRCYFMQTVPVVGADQRVYACHNKAYDMTGCIGSIKERSFRDLWFSDDAKAFFEKLNPQCDCRHQCANDSKNKHMMNLISTAHDN
ncbi:MAG TPA: radical SAM protein, partial [Tepidisphaeraceae bacterium]|nr:radical SAM protein [Tepidisphaeraceae bacterium]